MATTQMATARRDIPKEALEEMMKSKLTDVKIAQAFSCSPKTVARRMDELGPHRRALMKSTPGEVLREHIEEYLRAENKPKFSVEMTMSSGSRGTIHQGAGPEYYTSNKSRRVSSSCNRNCPASGV
ncbi:hypothetical protein QFC20_003063 [Naganishia adeliensis]|uniref:Uncharacterized protein n=1 Tax=Naganishia adeliensis TaxID=92952 RepID=A0ACC2WE03_9TREE|nr:hypothetical protein QFC20_003063 [Naganishia adeliensis]